MFSGLNKKFTSTWGYSPRANTNTNNATQQGSATSANSQRLQRSQTMPKHPSDWVLVHVGSYNLRWDKLQEWLVEHFENDKVNAIGGGFSEKQHLNDIYYFYAPHHLTEGEKIAIDELRDKNPSDVARQRQREKYTPDREEQVEDED
ncbi:hypothetical protein CNYM01_05260 [Colletotrichum nymphaeae SA-01]|uniref:Uncharacterized protein n=1 Tax=Colletotrichum nymphaeae SA-01 TaxID=1460502 RepID=A0A135RRQ1_9PEZI|nr:hypothetical protein CNYM01_05260 [Colletotrichum nymphaeae SA-01]